ncbi:M23 family metallopeptidase [Nocardiopsis coralliicola]
MRALAAAAAAVLALASGAAAAGPLPAAAAPPAAAAQWSAPLAEGVRVVRPFAPPAERWLPGHRGVDLAAPRGAAVRAAGAGRVAFAGTVAGTPAVSVDHGALRTTYLPVDAAVASGDAVHRGGVLGTLAAQPPHCRSGPCLHWGLRRGRTYLDPLALLGMAPVRLLPLDGLPGAAAAGTRRPLRRAGGRGCRPR